MGYCKLACHIFDAFPVCCVEERRPFSSFVCVDFVVPPRVGTDFVEPLEVGVYFMAPGPPPPQGRV